MPLPAALLGMIPSLINKGVEIFDKKFQTDAEKEKAVREYKAEMRQEIEDAWDKEQAHVTERHKNDMHSDSPLSKNIRPMVLVYLMALFTLAFFMEVGEDVMDLLGNLLLTTFAFYFGSRTLDKFTKAITNKKS